MNINLLIGTVILFILGRGLLSLLYKKVSPAEAAIIRRKYYGWIPISVFLFVLIFAPQSLGTLLYSAILSYGLAQIFYTIWMRNAFSVIGAFIVLLLTVSASTFYLYYQVPQWVLLIVIFGSVFADISAYSFAKLARHTRHLPAFINKEKTFEGIFGEMIGPFFTLIFLRLCGIDHVASMEAILIAFATGVGAVIGDLLNSIAKRLFQVKEWGTGIGHGGVFDRFASIFVALACVFVLIQFHHP